MPMPLRAGYGVKTYYKRGVMIFCNGAPAGQVPPYSAIDGNIDMIFNWIPWHSKNYDSHNWNNSICNNLELGPVISCVQARCFKPFNFADAILNDMITREKGIMFSDFTTEACTEPNHLNSTHQSHDLARLNNFVCKIWPPDSYDQVTEQAGQTQPQIELMMAWDADWLKNQALSKWDIGTVARSPHSIGEPDRLPLRFNSSVKYLRLGADGVEIPIKWKSETAVRIGKNDAGGVETGNISREDYATDWHDIAAFPKVTSKVLMTQMVAWPNTMQKTLKARHAYQNKQNGRPVGATLYSNRIHMTTERSNEEPSFPTSEEIKNAIIACPYEIFGNIEHRAAR